ncbi:peroxide stress protein YaaA [Nocardioides yefusunii]|uniref:Peroxide stress protein YaaA n=1 Tax=Nocardioides yefusunii TaxID=2500546 RepID=A0ABW1QRI7_9ACTN|nr:peroxide stress protein YaaA [Nocardioides yefusunii]
MLILLPPSEGKFAPTRGKNLDLDTLSHPSLTAARSQVLDALVTLCSVSDEAGTDAAAATLGLGPKQRDLVARNASLREAATARADAVYTGVLYDALNFETLSAAAKRRATTRVGIASALFGLLSPADRIPAYRLSGDATLPGVGALGSVWRPVLGEAVEATNGDGLLVDLRSGMYANLWRPATADPEKVAGVRVLHQHNGQRKVVSHFNKATKGRIVRALMEDGGTPRTTTEFADALRDLGWYVETGKVSKKGTELDVVVHEI